LKLAGTGKMLTKKMYIQNKVIWSLLPY